MKEEQQLGVKEGTMSESLGHTHLRTMLSIDQEGRNERVLRPLALWREGTRQRVPDRLRDLAQSLCLLLLCDGEAANERVTQ